jgi:mannose-6-phosphate isomerase-like protein (cupin superfamily)
MSTEIFGPSDFTALAKPGVTSLQILWPGNAPNAKVTITRVTLEPGAIQTPHSHEDSEQVWLIERGEAQLLLGEDNSRRLIAGEVVRTPAKTVHGLRNTGREPFVYLAVTTPPADFRGAYKNHR